MIKNLYKTLLLLFVSTSLLHGQGTIITSPPLTANNGSGGVTFEVESTIPIIITDIANTFNSGAQTVNVWMRVGGVQSTPGAAPTISVANGWSQVITGVSVTGNNTTPVLIPGGPYSIAIPAATPVGFFIEGNLRYQSHTGPPDVFSDGTLTIRNGPNFGYGGNIPSPTFSPRQFLGEVTYILAGPCTAPPIAGATQAADTTICIGNTTRVSLSGNTAGTGQTYQWESSLDNVTWTTMVGDTLPSADVTPPTSTYYRCQVTCSGQTAASTPLLVNAIGTPLPGGTYTINSGLPTAGTNYASFSDFFGSIVCGGVAGPIVVNVAPNSGPYVEQVFIGDIGGTSATNTITVNGNGETVQFASSNNAERGVFMIDGTSYLTLDDLVIDVPGSGTSGYGIHMFGGAHHNTVSNCHITVDQTQTSSFYAGIVLGSGTSATGGAGNYPENITIEDNLIEGGYYSVTVIGNNNTDRAIGNRLINNQLLDWRFYGLYTRAQEDLEVIGNEIARENNTNVSSFYGIYMINEHHNALIRNNSIHDPFGGATNTSIIYAMYMTGASGTAAAPNLVYNNIFYNLENNGTLYGIWNASSSHWKYYHNTIDVNDANPTAALTRGFYLSGNSDSVDIVNNVVSISRTGTSTKHCIYILGSGVRTINNNGYFIDYNASTNSHVGYDGSNQTLFSDWVANTNGWDNNSVFDNADFTNPAAGVLVPGSGAMNDIGQDLLSIVPVDYVDTARTITPDPGAFEFDPPPCPRPSVNISSTTDTSSILTWSSGIAGGTYNIEWGPTGFNRGTGFTQTITGDSVQLTGLAGNTCYDIYVQLDCSGAGNGFSQWSFVFTWCTNCGSIVPPFNEGFETWTNGLVPNVLESCYSYATQGGVNWQINTGTTSSTNTGPNGGALSSSKYMYLETSSGTTNDEAYLILPIMNVSGLTSPEIRFFYHMFGATTNELRIDVSDNLGVTWDSIWGLAGQQQTASADPYILANASLAAYGTSTNLLIRIAGKRGTSFTGDIAVDNITVGEAPQCPLPSFPTVASLTSTDVTVQWDPGAGISTNLSYGAVGFTPANGVIASTVDTFLTVSGLTPQTTYEVYIQDSCSDGTLSPWVGPLSFTTACAVTAVPFTESFETWSIGQMPAVLAPCYTYNGGALRWETRTGTTGSTNTGPSGGANGSNQYAFLETSFGAANDESEIVFPIFDLTTLNVPELRFFYHMYGATINELRVEGSSDGGATWVVLWSEQGEQQTAETDPYLEAIVSLDTVKSAATLVKFVGVRGTSFTGDLAIDDISIVEAPACPGPLSLTAGNITQNSADLSWTQAGSINTWELEWGPIGFTPGTGIGTVVSAGTNPFTLTGLPSDSCVEVYVRADCNAASNGYSVYDGPVQICTLKEFDAALSLFNSPAAYGCGDSATTVEVSLTNLGVAAITSLPITVEVTGDITQTLNFTYSGSLSFGASTTVTVGTLNTYDGADISLTAYGVLPNDQDGSNDTVADFMSLLIPVEPFSNDTAYCGLPTGPVKLYANAYPGMEHAWYDVPTGGTALQIGDTLSVPAPTASTTYYLEYESFEVAMMADYNGGDIASDFDFRTTTDTSTCPGTITVNVPVGVNVIGVDIAYDIEAAAGAWMSEQRSELRCVTTGLNEGAVASGTGLGGIMNYSRTGLTIANGVTTTSQLVFELHVGRTWGGGGCDASFNKALANSIELVVHYQDAPCSSIRVPVEIVIEDVPTADFSYTLTGSTVDFTDASLDADSLYWDFAGQGNSSDPNPVFTFTTGGSQQVCLYAFNDCGVDTLCETITSISAADLAIDQSLRVFPNPSTGVYNVSFDLEGVRNIHMRVLSPTGQLILDNNLGRKGGSFNTTVDLSGFAKGIYILQVETENGVATRRLNLM